MPPGKVDVVHELAEDEGRVILRLAGAGGDVLKLAGTGGDVFKLAGSTDDTQIFYRT